ncbi:MAG: BatD family protein [Verrucomicrobia bacterium]|nr:BatD family protein [Verrucomicrobiota bacterium]
MCGIADIQAAEARAVLRPDTIPLGAVSVLKLIFEGGEPEGLEVPEVEGLRINPAGRSHEIRSVNGRMSVRTILSYQLQPSEQGSFKIPVVSAVVNGEKVETEPVTLVVTEPDSSEASTLEDYAYLNLVVPYSTIYEGQYLPLEARLYERNARNVSRPELEMNGFTLENSALPSAPARSADGRFNIWSYQYLLTPTKTGELTLGPAKCSANLLVRRSQNRQSRDMYDPFSLLNNGMELRQAELESDILDISVKPLPTNGMPAGFSGAIGDFTFSVNARPRELVVGDPITVRFRISGKGSFSRITEPPDADWTGFKSYPYNATTEKKDAIGMEAEKVFEQVVAPTNAATQSLPEFRFAFFDPNREQFIVQTNPPIEITVRSDNENSAVQNTAQNTSDEISSSTEQGLAHIKSDAEWMNSPPMLLIDDRVFQVMLIIPALILVGGVLIRKRKEKLEHDPLLQRRHRVAGIIRRGMKTLDAAAVSGDAERFFETAFRLLQEKMGERLDMPASSITGAVIDERLRLIGTVDDALITEIEELFQACDQARFAPETGVGDLESWNVKIKDVLKKLDKRIICGIPPVLLVVFTLLFTGAVVLRAGSDSMPNEQFIEANRHYETGDFKSAIAGYREIIESGFFSSALYFNMGNAWYKTGDNGKAILYYLRARELAPRNKDVLHNLEFVREKSGVSGDQKGIAARLGRIVSVLTVNEWAGWFLVFEWMLAALCFYRFVWPGNRRIPRWIFIVTITMFLAGSIGLYARLAAYYNGTAVVTSGDATVRYGPMKEASIAFSLDEGAIVSILRKSGDGSWSLITRSGEERGWITSESIERVRRPQSVAGE